MSFFYTSLNMIAITSGMVYCQFGSCVFAGNFPSGEINF